MYAERYFRQLGLDDTKPTIGKASHHGQLNINKRHGLSTKATERAVKFWEDNNNQAKKRPGILKGNSRRNHEYDISMLEILYL